MFLFYRRNIYKYLIVFFAILFFSESFFAQEDKSSSQDDAYRQMYEQFFGKAPPEQESIEIPVDFFIDLQPVGQIIILSDTFSKWYKLSKSDFETHILPLIKYFYRSTYILELESFDQKPGLDLS